MPNFVIKNNDQPSPVFPVFELERSQTEKLPSPDGEGQNTILKQDG